MSTASNEAAIAARFDVFLSHNRKDKGVVQRVARRLKAAGLKPWLDAWELTPGGRWQEELRDGIRASDTFAYFIGTSGEGDWAREELDEARIRAAKDRKFRLIPVLLPGLPEKFDSTSMPAFLSSRTWVDLRGGVTSPSVQRLINLVLGVPVDPGPVAAAPGVSPYRGLRAFEREDAPFFFGREADVQRLVEMLKGNRFVAVLGPSGSGKSSLVRAGLVPALERGALPASADWKVVVLRPGARPLESFAAKLETEGAGKGMARTLDELAADERSLHLAATQALGDDSNNRFVWVVDQAEELFTLCRDDDERERTIARLLYAVSVPGGRTVVVLAMRADFYARCAAYPALAAHIAKSQYLVSPMTPEGIRAAIEEPAAAVDLRFEEGLVETIMADIESQPGALPLLEHALLELWERRRGDMLTLEGYRLSGGVHGAIAKRAEAIYTRLDPADQEIVQRAVLRLTQPGQGTEDTRRRASMRELISRPADGPRVEAVVQELTDARLLTASADELTGEAWVDLSHEALIRGWPRVREWLDADRASHLIHRRLTDAADEWGRRNRDESYLYRGSRLTEALDWRAAHEADLNDEERAFVDASLRLTEHEGRSAARRRRLAISGAVAGLILVVALIAGAAFLSSTALAAEAERQRSLAVSLGFTALDMVDRPDLALLLAVQATRIADVPALSRVLVQELNGNPGASRFVDGDFSAAGTSPGGDIIAIASAGEIWVGDHGSPLRGGTRLTGGPAGVRSIAVDASGAHVAAVGDDTLFLWTMPDPTPVEVPALAGAKVAFIPDGSIAVADGAGQVDLYDAKGTARRTVLAQAEEIPPNSAWPVFSRDGSLVARSEVTGVHVYGLPAAEEVALYAIESDRAYAIDSRAGLIAVHGSAGLDVHDFPSGQLIKSGIVGEIESVDFVGGSRLFGVHPSIGAFAVNADGSALTVLGRASPGEVVAAVTERGAMTMKPGLGLVVWDVAQLSTLARRDMIQSPSVASTAQLLSPSYLLGQSRDGLTRVGISMGASPGDPAQVPPGGLPTQGPGGPLPPPDLPPPELPPGPPGGPPVPGSPPVTPLGPALDGLVVNSTNGESHQFRMPASVAGVIALAVSTDGLTMAEIDLDFVNSGFQLVRRSTADGSASWRVTLDDQMGASLAFSPVALSPDGQSVALIERGKLTVRSMDDGSLVQELADLSMFSPTAIDFSADAKTLAVVGATHPPASISQSGPPGSVAPNQAALALVPTGGLSGPVELRELPGTLARAVAIAPGGERLAVAVDTQTSATIHLYDVTTMERIASMSTVPLPGDRYVSLAFSADGTALHTAGSMSGWLTWPATLLAWQQTACALVGRDMTGIEWSSYLSSEDQSSTCGFSP